MAMPTDSARWVVPAPLELYYCWRMGVFVFALMYLGTVQRNRAGAVAIVASSGRFR